MIISLLRWIEYDRTSKHGYSDIPFLNAHLKTGWLSLIDNVFGQCTKLLFCWKIFSVKDKRDSITSLPLIIVLWEGIIHVHHEEIWVLSIGNVINRTQYPFEELNCHFHIKMIYTSFHTPHPTNMIHLYLTPLLRTYLTASSALCTRFWTEPSISCPDLFSRRVKNGNIWLVKSWLWTWIKSTNVSKNKLKTCKTKLKNKFLKR